MPRLVPLPTEFRHRAFSTDEAHRAGLGDGRLRGGDLHRPFHGVRSTAEATDLADRCRSYLPRLRDGQFFSHETAARLWGVPLPAEEGPWAPLHVSAFAPNRPPRTRGVVGHELRPGTVQVRLRAGLPVAAPASTWLQLGSVLGVADLVAAADHLALDPVVLDPRDPRPYVAESELAAALRDFRGRGRRALVAALELTRPGAESRPETLLRLLLVRAGLPEPEVNVAVRDAHGRFVARVDLAYPDLRVAVEYDGDHHRTSTLAYEHDIARFDRLHEAGWRVVRVRARGLFRHPDDTVDRVRRALAAARPGA
ncbi:MULTISPECIES: endonuclease domain-containing protein [unclassified Agromyces]|uniref:endonuclease domain-containing protein n=1 Tax=unclassified Agromyces TaxID=2639701 RepID=UPI0030158467